MPPRLTSRFSYQLFVSRLKILHHCLTLLLLISTATAHAVECKGPTDRTGLGLGVYFDQDLFVPGTNDDRDYTMGVGIEVFQDRGPLYLFRDLIDLASPLVGFDRRCGRLSESYMFGSQTFTPDDISNPAPIFDDRPYASLLYLSNKRVVADERHALGIEFLVGAIGLDISEQVQSSLHEWVRERRGSTEPRDPKGWRHQISDGGEPTVRLRIASSTLLVENDYWDLARTWDVSIGFQTNASLGLSTRLGQMSSPFWTVPYDPIGRGNFMPSLKEDELYFWAAGRVRGVAYDALLQGQFRDSEVTVDYDDMRKLVWETGVGVTKGWPGFQMTAAVNAKAGDTTLSRAPEEHVWGGLYFSWWFD